MRELVGKVRITCRNLSRFLLVMAMSKPPKQSTKSRLLDAAIAEFSDHGFKGASLRDIAKRAHANVAAVKYHYTSKDELWRAVVAHLYGALRGAVFSDEPPKEVNSIAETIRESTREYILFSAQNPELYRITMFELIEGGERLEWLANNQLREFLERTMSTTVIAQEKGVFDKMVPPLNLVYIMMGAIQTLFVMAPQIERSFETDVFDAEQVDNHIESIMRMFRL